MKKIMLLAAAMLTLAACHRDPHFITDRDYRNEVHADFEARMANFPMLQVKLDTLSRMEREAMEFLYAYMPLSDLADHEPAFYLDQVRYALRAREEMPWGKDIPEDVFRHFVLVYRVNNENLDSARMVFYRELKERVKGMTIEEAALEVNHWCHEHVAYRASDSRTSSPLATMRTSLGRCGEESTFTVTALRAVGIPARQCYTPRWAHCDDNHAWVEVWVGNTTEGSEPHRGGNTTEGSESCKKKYGKWNTTEGSEPRDKKCRGEWKFMGACEPDPRLNMGWFSVPSTRCMMVHTKAFGKYKGATDRERSTTSEEVERSTTSEEVVRRTGLYSELNLLSHYAPTRRVTVTVIDGNADPVEGAQVKFKLYNYAEYYTLATVITDAEGKASLTTGLGDLLIWTTDGDRYAFEKIDVRRDSTLTLVLGTSALPGIVTFEIVPPMAGEPKVTATEEETAANARRLAYEDSLRNAYVATFPSKDFLQQLEGIQYFDKEQQEQLWELVHKSEGNYETILTFISKHGLHEEQFGPVYDYLSTFSDKDLRDITAATLEAHWTTPETLKPLNPQTFKPSNPQTLTVAQSESRANSFAMPSQSNVNERSELTLKPLNPQTFQRGLLPARISNEMVRPYRKELSCFKGMTAEEIRQWVMDSIAVDDSSNYFGCPISPVGVYRLRRADSHSRDIFFVAACRAAGIPAYLDNATNIIYCWEGKAWVIKDLKDSKDLKASKDIKPASLTLTYHGTNPAKPLYWPHFTLAKLENGDLRTFDFEDDPRMASFPATLNLEPGIYCLSTGNRYPDGAVRSRLEFFELYPEGEPNSDEKKNNAVRKAGEQVTKEIVILPLVDKLNTEHLTLDTHLELFDGIELWDYAGDAGMLYINLGDYSEPSKHLVVELMQQQKELKQWGGMTFMVGPSTVDMPSWGLANTDFAYSKGALEQELLSALHATPEYPLVALIDKEGHILYHSEGYKIGVIEQVLKARK